MEHLVPEPEQSGGEGRQEAQQPQQGQRRLQDQVVK